MNKDTILKIKNVVQWSAHIAKLLAREDELTEDEQLDVERRSLQLDLWRAELRQAKINPDPRHLLKTYFRGRRPLLINFREPADEEPEVEDDEA